MQTDRLASALSDRYRIESKLGAGGMATVYLAEDLKHDRKVAIKVLKPELAAVLGAERFVQEIKTTAALSHPHILPLFDSGTADGFLYYVMPYIKGETIREKLNRETQFGVDEAVRIAREVADALDYAHRHGVIHRDIKPENILLHDGRAMVMDFGIALAVSAAAGGRMTETGLSLGTPHYMSPEQATADKQITARSDVYSLASVLYEMVTGEPPHMGTSAQQIIMKIIAEPVRPATELRKSVPPHVEAALAKALEKLPADRFGSAKAFGDALSDTAFTRPKRASAANARSSDWKQHAAVPALAVAAAAMAFAVWAVTRPAPESPVRRYLVDFANPPRLANQWTSVAVSPDGRRIAYIGAREGGQRLYLRAIDQLAAVEVPGSDGAMNPFFSPDGNRVGFMVSANAIRTASVDGTPALTVVDSGVGSPGATWSPDGFIYFDQLGIGPLLRVRSQGGRPEPASMLDSTRGELQHVWPDALPNGRGVLMVVNHTGPGRQGVDTDVIAVVDTKTGQHRVLMAGVIARYAASGHIVYITVGGALMAVPFDQDRLEVSGEPFVIADGVTRLAGGTGAADLAISRDGMLMYAIGGGAVRHHELNWVGRSGVVAAVDPGLSVDIRDLSISPDGKRAALMVRATDGQDIWVKELTAGGSMDKLTFDGANSNPVWSTDGTFIDFASFNRTALADIRRVTADGSGMPTLIYRDRRAIVRGAWSPRGEWLAFETYNQDLYAIRPGVDSNPVPLAVTAAVGETNPAISPDGKWLLYNSRRTGVREVYVAPFPNSSTSLKQVSSDGGTEARWSRDGREIFYRNAAGEMVAVAVVSSDPISLGARRVLFKLPDVVAWDVAPDGRFLVVLETGASATSTTQIVVVEGLFQELRARDRR
ncbi:MAG TPA: protein kinase [Gemmatimonadaceae bacterium]